LATYYKNNKAYFDWQIKIGKFGGKANLFKFEKYIKSEFCVVDFGCGGGCLLKNINSAEKLGIEPNNFAMSELEKNGIKAVESPDQVPDFWADVVISNHTLEHVENPLGILLVLRKKIKKNGRLVFVIPLQNILEDFNPEDINHHLYSWNRQTIGNLFKHAGFDEISVDLIQHQWPPDYFQLYQEKGEAYFHNACCEYAKKNNNYQIRVVAGCSNQSTNSVVPADVKQNIIKSNAVDVPVILMTYNRPFHTQKVLEILKKQNRKKLYIFSDGSKNECDILKVDETRLLLKNIDWCRPEIIEREKNIGLANSIVSAVNYVFEKHDKLILLEDDCVPQKHFFLFMEKCLKKYEHNEKIFGISGYSVAIDESILKKYPYDLYFFPRIGSWGWATWKRAWQHFEPDLSFAYNKAKESSIDLSQGGSDIPVMIRNMLNGNLTDVWTLNWVLSVYLQKGYYIYPTTSHIENIGWDGSGTHCSNADTAQNPFFEKKPERYPDDVCLNQNIYTTFRLYYDVVSCSDETLSKAQILEEITALLNENSNDKALALFDMPLLKEADIKGYEYGKAVALARTGRSTEAIDILKQILSSFPEHIKAKLLFSELINKNSTDTCTTHSNASAM